jgi:hypothetical protein
LYADQEIRYQYSNLSLRYNLGVQGIANDFVVSIQSSVSKHSVQYTRVACRNDLIVPSL